MRAIAVMSEKGGVAKTITVANLGPALAARGLRVLLVDFDPQGDLSASFGVEEFDDELVRVEDLLAGTHDDADAALLDVAPAGLEGRLWLLAASSELRGQTARLLRGAGDALAGLLDALDTPTDVVLVDTPAGETIFAAQAIVAAAEIIVMVLPGYLEPNDPNGHYHPLGPHHLPTTLALPRPATYTTTRSPHPTTTPNSPHDDRDALPVERSKGPHGTNPEDLWERVESRRDRHRQAVDVSTESRHVNTLYIELEQLTAAERRDLANALLRAAWSAALEETRVLLLDLLTETDESVLGDPA